MPGVPLGLFGGSTYDDLTMPVTSGDVFVFCSDGIFEAFDEAAQEFGTARTMAVIEQHWQRPAKEIVDAVVRAVQAFSGEAVQADDRTIVVVKIT
jgi:sigma-B regulation protein RsbU (phosphoserine phosphatase)